MAARFIRDNLTVKEFMARRFREVRTCPACNCCLSTKPVLPRVRPEDDALCMRCYVAGFHCYPAVEVSG